MSEKADSSWAAALPLGLLLGTWTQICVLGDGELSILRDVPPEVRRQMDSWREQLSMVPAPGMLAGAIVGLGLTFVLARANPPRLLARAVFGMLLGALIGILTMIFLAVRWPKVAEFAMPYSVPGGTLLGALVGMWVHIWKDHRGEP